MNQGVGQSAEVAAEKVRRLGGKTLADRISQRLWRLGGTKLRERACRCTSLEDFGDPPIARPLSILTDSLEREADLHPAGRFLMRMHLLEILETRLRLSRSWQSQTDTLEISPISRPVFITGMPRSGSTFLHELLSQDPDNRSPRAWEIMFPIPAPAAGESDCDSRVRKAAACFWWFRRLAPQADAVHPLRAFTPHEGVAIHSYTLLSEEFISTCRIPTYERFLRSEGLGAAYSWQKRFLQHLQSRCPTRQWILKSPDHLCALEALFSVFPDAVIIHTHRNPLAVLKSSIQLTRVLHGLFSRADDEDQLQNQQAKTLAERMECSIRFRDHHPELAGRFLDVNYTDLVSRPIETVERIYRHLDRPLTGRVMQKMRPLILSRARYRHPPEPAMARPGFDALAKTGWFQSYCRRFGIPSHQPEAG